MDVLGARPVSLRISADLSVKHESPQALWLSPDGRVLWHADHAGITPEALGAQVGGA